MNSASTGKGLLSVWNRTFPETENPANAVFLLFRDRPKHVIRQALVHANVSSGYQTLDHANRLVFFGHELQLPAK